VKPNIADITALSAFSFTNFSFGMRWAGSVARMGERRDVYRIFGGGSEGKRPLERPRRRREDNIKM